MTFTFYLPLAIWALLETMTADSVEAVLLWVDARSKACMGLSRMAKVVRVCILLVFR